MPVFLLMKPEAIFFASYFSLCFTDLRLAWPFSVKYRYASVPAVELISSDEWIIEEKNDLIAMLNAAGTF
jgi:hypothetical protein